MDFFGILFDMKNGKKIPYSKTYFDTLFAENLAGVTTLTGTLPLTFTTSETALRSWTIYGNNTAHIATSTSVFPLTFTTTEDKLRDWEIYGNAQGVGERTVNLFDKDDFVANAPRQRCTVEATSTGLKITATSNDPYIGYNIEDGQSASSLGGMIEVEPSTTYRLYSILPKCYISFIDASKTGCANTLTIPSSATYTYYQFTTPSNCKYIMMRLGDANLTSEQEFEFSNIMLVKGSTVPSTYVPYGYEIPISVNGNAQTFYIGSSPLTAGQSISKTSTGVDIATTEGENTISSTLYNKPETAISFVDFVGVGEKSGNDWQIPLTISDGTNTATVNVPIDAPLTDGQSITDTRTISTFVGENTVDTTLENKPQMSITYKGD